MEGKEIQKIDLVNPLNPNQIIKTEILTNKDPENIQNNSEQIVFEKSNKNVVIIVMVAIIIAIAILTIVFL